MTGRSTKAARRAASAAIGTHESFGGLNGPGSEGGNLFVVAEFAEFVTVPGDDQRVDGELSHFAVEFEAEAIGQQGLKHLLRLGGGGRTRGLGDDGVAIAGGGSGPIWRTGELVIEDAVGFHDEIGQGDEIAVEGVIAELERRSGGDADDEAAGRQGMGFDGGDFEGCGLGRFRLGAEIGDGSAGGKEHDCDLHLDERLPVMAAYPGMRPFILLLMASATCAAQAYVRPWVVAPPKKAASTLDSPLLRAVEAPQEPAPAPKPVRRRISIPASLLEPARLPLPLILTPCTSFPGNPVFVIEGDKVTMRKDPVR